MYHVIVNPGSKSGKALQIWEKKLQPILVEQKIKYKLYLSTLDYGLDRVAADIEADNPEGELLCILIGGDGTLNQFIQGFADMSRVILGLVCCGSGNDLARDLSLPSDPVKALNQILEGGMIHGMDMGEIQFANGKMRRFITSTGLGFDAAVCEEVDRSKIKKLLNKIGLGKLIYLGIAIKQLFRVKAVDCTLTIDDAEPKKIGPVLFVAGMNHRFEGGGFKFCPKAKCNDGILNLCVVRNIPRFLILLILPTAFGGFHTIFRGIDAYTGKKYHIKVNGPSWIHTDGEVVSQETEFDVVCKKEAFRMIY